MKRLSIFLLIIVLLISFIPVNALMSSTNRNPVMPYKVTISGSKYVAVGKKITLKATILPLNGGQNVLWSSSNKKIATVSKKGIVKGISPGTVKITAIPKDNPSIKATFKIKVMARAASKVQITGAVGALDLSGVSSVRLKAKITPKQAAQTVEWKSSDANIATVSSKGVVQAISTGTVKITATATDGSKKKASVTITVIDSGAVTPTPNPTLTPTPEPTPTLTVTPTSTPTATVSPPKTGWVVEDGNTYYYDQDGNMVTGWYRIDHRWYWFRPDGIMLVGKPDIADVDILYEDDTLGILFLNWHFRPDGQYNIFEGFIDRSFYAYDESSGQWIIDPVSISVCGTEYEATGLMVELGDDGSGTFTLFNSQTDNILRFGFTWRQPGDNFMLDLYGFTSEEPGETKDTFILSEYQNTFDLEIHGITYYMHHSNGNG